MEFWTDVLDFCQNVTQKVGTQLLADFGQVQASHKDDGSLVTQSDQWADETIAKAIANHFPTHGILSEEAQHIFPAHEWCWIIDPLDGTTNFTRGIPIWGISLGLLYKGTPVFGYVHFPPIGQSFHGFWNAGFNAKNSSFVNNKSIHSSTESPSSNHFFNLCSRSTSIMQQPFPCKIRMLGVATYNFLTVATGAVLGSVEATPKIWDIAAAWVIVKAAGGVWIPLDDKAIFPLKVGDNYGKRSLPTLVASSPELLNLFKPLVLAAKKGQT